MDREEAGKKELPKEAVFALDIGTRSIIGMLGFVEKDKLRITAVERAEHSKRAMVDGQIEDIREVARLAGQGKEALEEKSGYRLDHVFVAAAGRALKTETASFEMEFPGTERISEEIISRLEAGAVSEAQKNFLERENDRDKQFFLVGYTVSQYYLDGYLISSLVDHKGKKIKADIVATFLPGEVVESLYSAMNQAGMEVAGLTLEPIAAINVAIPEKLRLLNLVMVDIGAGTSDIAVCRDGKVVGYTMATLAGDEITESIMKKCLVDFDTAEMIKIQLGDKKEVVFTDILGFEHRVPTEQLLETLEDAVSRLGREIADRILEVNGGAPSAVFLAGGGSRMNGLMEQITGSLGLDAARASVAGRYFSIHAFSDICNIEDPEYATPLGIAVSAGLNLINDSFSVILNGKQAKLFSNGTLHISDLLMMNGYTYGDLMGRSGKGIVVTVDGVRRIFYGTPAEPAVLKLNGEEAKISDLVHAGDDILFIPAVNGTDARATAADIYNETGSGPEHSPIMINGEYAGMDRVLNYGDEIITVNAGKKETPEEAEAAEAPAAETVPEEEEQPLIPEPEQTIQFQLNGKNIRLPGKPDGTPYYLMDMLQYSGLDMDNITAPVVLEVNGISASFQRILKENDIIAIYEEKSNRP